MTLRSWFGAALGALPLILSAQTGQPTWSKPVVRDFPEPAWWDQGVVMVGNWEGLDYRRRMGGQGKAEMPVDLEADYLHEHSEEVVRQLKDAGVNLVCTHFYKMGLVTDAEDNQVAKAFVALCHRYGIKVGAYVGGSLFTETDLHDVPGAADWVSRDQNGQPISYGGARYRYLPDFNHPGYVEYMKKVLRFGIQDIGFDFFHFDNMVQPSPPRTGSTPDVNRRFREFLQTKYTPAELKERLGFSDISAVTVPAWNEGANAPGAINDPLIQEWTDFRCQDLADYYGKLCTYMRQLNPDVVIELNCTGISDMDSPFLRGVDHDRLVTHGSVFVSEEQSDARVDAAGVLWSKIRSYKMGLSLDETVITYDGPPQWDTMYVLGSNNGGRGGGISHSLYRALTAESMAFNRNFFGLVGWVTDAPKWPTVLKDYIRFYHEQNRHYRGIRQVADVAILRSFPSLAYNGLGPQHETVGMEQVLIQHKIPFAYVMDGNLADLSKYRVLILADQEALPDKEISQITDYVRQGGALVATGQTSLFTEWRRKRMDYGLADVLGIHYQEGAMPKSHQQTFGQGRVAYVRSVGAAVAASARRKKGAPAAKGKGGRNPEAARGAADPEAGGGGGFNTLPANAAELAAAIRYAANGPLAVEFTAAPLTTVMELNEKKDGSERILHWLNYKEGETVPGATVTMAVPAGKTVSSVEFLTPDGKAGSPLDFTTEGDRIRFAFPPLEVYDLAVVHYH